MAVKPFITDSITRQLPEFIREDYPSFVSFLEAYYEWLDENYTKRNLKELRDIDETLDAYVQHIRNELNVLIDDNFEHYATLSEREYLKYAKLFYSSKGSEAAHKLLFRVLYGKEIDIVYPSQSILRASDGRWQQDISFFVEITSGEATDIIGKQITITTSAGVQVLTAFVERIVNVSGNSYEVFVQRYYGTVQVGYKIAYDNVAGDVTGTTTSYTVLDGGAGFTVGQIFDIESVEGSGSKIKVTKIDSDGGIEKVQIVKFGVGFLTPFVTQVAPQVTSFSDTSPITVYKNSIEQFEVPSNTSTGGFSETGYITRPDYFASDYAEDGTYAGTAITTFTNEYIAGTNTENLASIRFDISAQINYPGYYSSNDGFISDNVFIQDSRYYQAFSYVVRIDELLDGYKDALKAFAHPSGMALFAEFEIENNFDMTLGIEVAENFIRLFLADGVTVPDTITKAFTFDPRTDSVTISEGLVYELNKDTITESITLSDSGGVYLNSYTEGSYFAGDYVSTDLPAETF